MGCRLCRATVGFLGYNSSGAQSQKMAAQEALMEALLPPKNLNLQHIIMLTNAVSQG